MFLGPALFLLLLEGSLRVVGYGRSANYLQKLEGQDAYVANPRFGPHFLDIPVRAEPALCFFPAKKGDNTCRIFVLGESAAMGFPDPAFGFSRFLEVMLRENYPDVGFEVLNTSMAAINSHLVLRIARECARQKPDMFIIYMGNNEVVGPYGPGTIFAGFSPNLTAIRASLWAKSTQVGQLMCGLLEFGRRDVPEWRWMQMFLDHRISADDPRMEGTYACFRGNLEDMCRVCTASGAKVVVCTVPTNLKDCAPFASTHRKDLSEEQRGEWDRAYQAGVELEAKGDRNGALRLYLAASKIDDRFADLHFRLGRCYLGLGKAEEARGEFVMASDLDALRFRADARINEIIRQVASGRQSEGVWLVDTVQALEQSLSGARTIPGEEFLYEHVHLNAEGNYAFASALLSAVGEAMPPFVRSHVATDKAPSFERCAERLALTPWNRFRDADFLLKVIVSNPPFTAQLDYAEWRQRLFEKVHQLRLAAMAPAAVEETLALYRRAVAANPDDLILRKGYSEILHATRRYAEEQSEIEASLARLPVMADLHLRLMASLLAQGRSVEAEKEFEQGLRWDSAPPSAYKTGGEAFAQHGNIDKALSCYREALKVSPRSIEARLHLADLLITQNKLDEAVAEIRQAAALNPETALVEYWLGTVHLRLNAMDEAVAHLSRAVALDPYTSQIHDDLATALALTGRTAEAISHLADAVRLDPYGPAVRLRYARLLHLDKQFGPAAREYREAMRLSPDPVVMKVDLAWLLATCPEDSVRSAPEAVQLGEEANRTTEGKDLRALEVLAAAYAAAGRFADAVRPATTALELAAAAGRTGLAKDMQDRLQSYRAGRPFVTSLPYQPGKLEERVHERAQAGSPEH